jgi:predicted TIM-barrel fold metal-dependent hydrolase
VEIVDAQVHLPRIVTEWRAGHPRAIAADAPAWDPPRQPVFEPADADTILTATLTAMHAAGVDALVIDEWLGHDRHGRMAPGMELPRGGYRNTFELSAYAADRYPERFSFLARVDIDDPDPDEAVAQLAATPGMRCLRVSPMPWRPDLEAFRAGRLGPLFEAAGRHDLPVFVWSNGPELPSLVQYLERFPDLQFVLDHLGTGSPLPEQRGPERYAELDAVAELGRRYPNLAVKWSTVETQSCEPYPYADMRPYLLQALEAFGRERIMWASDWSQHKLQQSWAQSFWWLLESDELSADDKAWLLGRSARTIIRLPAVGDEVGAGLYFDCAHAHPAIRVTGATEDEFVANMQAHSETWHPQPWLLGTREQLLARARR